MKKISVLIVAILIVTSFISSAQKLVILHTNDMHSKITGFGPENTYSPLTVNDDNTLGGFSRLASLISQEKDKNAGSLIVCDAGDFLMGTIFQSAEPQTGFQINLMKQIGYDVITLGNHEFDFGPEAIADVINAGIKRGGVPPIVSTQMQFSDDNPMDDNLKKLVDDKVIKPYIILERNGLKIGIFGLLGYEAIFVSQNGFPITFADQVKTAKKYTKILREEEKVDIVMCLSHSGVYPDDKGVMIGEDLDLAKKVPDIDIIISGHTHIATPKYLQLGKTIIVQTGCYLNNLGRLEINYENGKVSVTDFKLIPVDDKIKGDKRVDDKINAYKLTVDSLFFLPYGYEYSKPVAEVDFDMPRAYYNPPAAASLGNLVPDAIMYYVKKYANGTDVVIAAQGVIREDVLKGEITPADIFRVAPLGYGLNDWVGYSLAQLYITGRELKKLAELAIFANKPGEDSYLYFSGMEVTYNPKGGFLNKVEKIVVNGNEVDMSKKNKKLYSVTANTYILSFIGEVKKMSKGLVVIVPKDSNGNPVTDVNKFLIDVDNNKAGIQEAKEWDAILKYLETFSDTDSDGLPNIPAKYKEFKSVFVEGK